MTTVYFIRHGETAWSKSGQHTGRTDIVLTSEGEEEACRLAVRLSTLSLSHLFCSPLQRARQTAALALPSLPAESDPDLVEWNYGDYEGLRSAEILARRPGWNLFRDGCPNGESPEQIATRADRVVARVRSLDGNIALVAHGHFGRILAVRWLGLPPSEARHFHLSTASISVLGYEHKNLDEPVIISWNETIP